MFDVCLDIDNINLSQLKIHKPIERYNRKVFNVFYNKKPFIIQSNIIQLTNINGRSIAIHNKKFVGKLNEIKRRIWLKLSKRCDIKLDNDEDVLYIPNIYDKDVTVYNMERKEIPFTDLTVNDRAIVLLYFQNSVVTSNKRVYMNIKMIQILRYEPLGIRKCMISYITPGLKMQPPPPPPPPPPSFPLRKGPVILEKKVVRPSLTEILDSIKKLKKCDIVLAR